MKRRALRKSRSTYANASTDDYLAAKDALGEEGEGDGAEGGEPVPTQEELKAKL